MVQHLGSLYVNFFLVEEAGAVTIVDAGMPGYLGQVEPALAQIGRTPADVRGVLLTHADPDHVGVAGAMQERYGTPVFAHALEAERVVTGEHKPSEGGSPLVGMLRYKTGRRVAVEMVRTARGAVKVQDVTTFTGGDELDLPGGFRVVHTPGHSDGHCVFVSSTHDALFLGDALTNVYFTDGRSGAHLTEPAGNTNTAQAFASLELIEDIHAATSYFGHGPVSTLTPRQLAAEARVAFATH